MLQNHANTHHYVNVLVQVFARFGEGLRGATLQVPQLVSHAAVEFLGVFLPHRVPAVSNGGIL